MSALTRPRALPRSESSTSPVWQGRSRASSRSSDAVVVQLVEVGGADLELGHPGPAGLGRRARRGTPAASRPTADALIRIGRSLETSVTSAALLGEVVGDREDPRVVVAEPEAGRQRRGVGVVELDPDRAAGVTDRHRLVEPAVQHAQLVERPQRGPGEVAQLGVVALALQLGDDHDRQDDLVLVEAAERARVGEQDAGVEDVGAGARRGGRRGRPSRRVVLAVDRSSEVELLLQPRFTPRRPTRALAPGPVRSL